MATHRWGYACCLLCEKDAECGGQVPALESGAPVEGGAAAAETPAAAGQEEAGWVRLWWPSAGAAGTGLGGGEEDLEQREE